MLGFPVGSVVKNLPASTGNTRDTDSIPRSRRWQPTRQPNLGNGTPLHYSCLENFNDRGAWRAAVHGVVGSWTWLSTTTTSCCCWCAKLYPTLWDPMSTRLPCPSPTTRACSNSGPLSQWCHSTILSSVALFFLSSVFPSIRVFPSKSALCIRWPKYWSFSFNISFSSAYSLLVFFSVDWYDLLAVCDTLKGLFQHHSSKISITWCFNFFIVPLSHLFMTTGKTTVLTRWIFVNKVMPQLFNTLSSFVIAFLPRSKCLLIAWLQSPSTEILEHVGCGNLVFLTREWTCAPCIRCTQSQPLDP